jgi:hypothetical protein
MKKLTILFSVMLIVVTGMMSFKAKNATRYGGTGSAKISVYKKTLLGDRGEKINTYTINVTESCTNYDKASAQRNIKNSIDSEAGRKLTRPLEQTWEYESDIDYRISSCD